MIHRQLLKVTGFLVFFSSSAYASVEMEDLKACHNSSLGWTVNPGEDSLALEEAGPFGSIIKKMYIDGMPRGWAFKYKDGSLVQKDFHDEYGQLDLSRTCYFNISDNRTFTQSGNGEKKPLLALNNGKPYKGFFELKDSKLYFKNGVAHGQALMNSFNKELLAEVTEKGAFYEGYKNGVFEVEWVSIVDKDQYVRLEYKYDMGEMVSARIVYAWPNLVSENLLLQKIDN